MRPPVTPFDAEAIALRDAAASGDFTAAEEAAGRLTSLLPELLAALPPREAEQRLRQACEVMAFARRNLCAARERIAGEMRRLDAIGQYHARLSESVAAISPHHLNVDG